MGLMQGLRRGLSAAGYAGADMYAKGALEDQRALIQAERDARLAEISEKATIGAEQRGLANRAAERGAIFQEGVAPERLAQTEAADRIKAEGALRTKTGLVGSTAKLAEDEFTAGANLRGQKSEEEAKADKRKRDAETQAEIDRSNNPAYLSGKAKVARAGHIDDGASLRAKQIEVLDLSLSEKKEANALVKEFGETTDPARQAQIKQALTVRGIIKPGEYDTEKVTTTSEDGLLKTERTQRRGAGATAGAATPKSQWNDATGEVMSDGRVIGKAKTADEARQLIGGAKVETKDAAKSMEKLDVSRLKVLSEAGTSKSLLDRNPEKSYNVQMPDGTVKVMRVSELKRLGLPVNQVMGREFYDPTYK